LADRYLLLVLDLASSWRGWVVVRTNGVSGGKRGTTTWGKGRVEKKKKKKNLYATKKERDSEKKGRLPSPKGKFFVQTTWEAQKEAAKEGVRNHARKY